jgi:hypothetical protein
MIRSKPYINNVSDPQPINRWTVPISDFLVSLKQAIKQEDRVQVDHLLNDFWLCDTYMLLKSDIQGEMQ